MTSQATSHIAATVGANIRLARQAKGIKQRDLAALLDTEGFMVSRWERGAHRPTDERMQALADALDRDVAWFYTDHSLREQAA